MTIYEIITKNKHDETLKTNNTSLSVNLLSVYVVFNVIIIKNKRKYFLLFSDWSRGLISKMAVCFCQFV